MSQSEPVENPFVCPFLPKDTQAQVIRRQDLLDLGNVFKSALSPFAELVSCMKQQNEQMEQASTRLVEMSLVLRKVVWGMVTLTLISALGVGMHFVTLNRLQATARVQAQTTQDISELGGKFRVTTDEMSSLKRATENTQQTVERQANTGSKVELVAETNPMLARRAPLKLRVSPPSALKPAPESSIASSGTIEISVPVESIK